MIPVATMRGKTPMIWTSPARRCGKPCIKGTRIDVETIVGCLQQWSIERIKHEFPPLTTRQVWAAISYYTRNRKRFTRKR